MATTAMATRPYRYRLVGVGAVAGMAEEVGTEAAGGMAAVIADAPAGSSRLDSRVKPADQPFLPNTLPSSSRIEPSGKMVTGKI